MRPCGDYIRLDAHTIHPIPLTRGYADFLANSHVFTRITFSRCNAAQTFHRFTTKFALLIRLFRWLSGRIFYRVWAFSASRVHFPKSGNDLILKYLGYTRCKLPKTVRDFRRLFGIVNFHRRFLPKAAYHQVLLNVFLYGPETKSCRKLCFLQKLSKRLKQTNNSW